MMIQQLHTPQLAHSSNLLAGRTECAIVDPRRDISIYLEAADSLGYRITAILETHLHADFVSGHLDLAAVTGAPVYAPKSAECKFEHLGLAEGDTFELDGLQLAVLETPGHTPEHISYVVSDTERGPEPVAVFCGDTLFVGDVGRPDLFPGRAEELAARLYVSLTEKLLKLPDFCEVYPAHAAGSLCGRALGAKRSSTIGYERLYNQALKPKGVEAFSAALLAEMPEAPDHFGRCTFINTEGPTHISELPELAPLSPRVVERKLASGQAALIDTRPFEAYGGMHVPGSFSIDLRMNFATFAGWVLPPDKELLLVADSPEQAFEATVWLHRVGLDDVVGYLSGGVSAWMRFGMDATSTTQLAPRELIRLQEAGEQLQLVDARTPNEFAGVHLEGSVNIPVASLRTRYTELDPALPTVVMCGSGQRSSLGCSLLEQRGFGQLFNLAGGVPAYQLVKRGPECRVCALPHGPQYLGIAAPVAG